MISEARQERADKVENVMGSDPTKVQVAPATAEIAEATSFAAYRSVKTDGTPAHWQSLLEALEVRMCCDRPRITI